MEGVTSCAITPRYARVTFPVLTIWSITLRATATGTAKPMPWLPDDPWARMAVLIPINSPRSFTSAPPEFPGLIDASVWMKSS